MMKSLLSTIVERTMNICIPPMLLIWNYQHITYIKIYSNCNINSWNFKLVSLIFCDGLCNTREDNNSNIIYNYTYIHTYITYIHNVYCVHMHILVLHILLIGTLYLYLRLVSNVTIITVHSNIIDYYTHSPGRSSTSFYSTNHSYH